LILLQDRVEGLKEFGLHRSDTILAVESMKNNLGGNIPICGCDALRMALLQHNLDVSEIYAAFTHAVLTTNQRNCITKRQLV